MALGNNLVKQKEEEIVQAIVEDQDLIVDEAVDTAEQELPEEEAKEEKSLIQYCVFKTNREEYAVPIDLVKEVVKYSKPAPLPQVPSYILGMTNIRGNVYGILDIEKFFGLDTEASHNYLLVLDHDIYKMTIGIPEVPDSLIIAEDEIENLSSSTVKSKVGQKYIRGVIKKENRMIIVFDIEGIISSEKFTIMG